MGQQANGENFDVREFHKLPFQVSKIKYETVLINDKDVLMIKSGSEFCYCLTSSFLIMVF